MAATATVAGKQKAPSLIVSGGANRRDPTSSRRWLTLAVLCVTSLLVSLDTTVLNAALPSIVRTLGASTSQLQWIVDAYAVVFAGLLLSMGGLGDRLGRKWLFMAGLSVFGAGSALAAYSGGADRLTVADAGHALHPHERLHRVT
jgi:MFS family permease